MQPRVILALASYRDASRQPSTGTVETFMLDLYHHGSSVCAAKVRFTLEEKGLGWKSHYLDILKGEQFAPEYVALNPKAVVPYTLVIDRKGNVVSTRLGAMSHAEIEAAAKQVFGGK